jgi:Mn-dependent DtxR family transcriptional regulator
MQVCSGQIRYLVAIVELSKKSNNVRGVDIARYLNITKPSVTKMLKCLVNSNLISQDSSFGIKLTQEGLEIGEKFYSNYVCIHTFFRRMLKIEDKSAQEQALEFVSTFPIETSVKFSNMIRNTIKKQKERKDHQEES